MVDSPTFKDCWSNDSRVNLTCWTKVENEPSLDHVRGGFCHCCKHYVHVVSPFLPPLQLTWVVNPLSPTHTLILYIVDHDIVCYTTTNQLFLILSLFSAYASWFMNRCWFHWVVVGVSQKISWMFCPLYVYATWVISLTFLVDYAVWDKSAAYVWQQGF